MGQIMFNLNNFISLAYPWYLMKFKMHYQAMRFELIAHPQCCSHGVTAAQCNNYMSSANPDLVFPGAIIKQPWHLSAQQGTKEVVLVIACVHLQTRKQLCNHKENELTSSPE